MRFEEALKAMRDGKYIRRKLWLKSKKGSNYTKIAKGNWSKNTIINAVGTPIGGFSSADIMAEDWEIVDE